MDAWPTNQLSHFHHGSTHAWVLTSSRYNIAHLEMIKVKIRKILHSSIKQAINGQKIKINHQEK